MDFVMSNGTNETDYDIDYDYNESINNYNWEELAPALAVYSLTFCLGLVGKKIIKILSQNIIFFIFNKIRNIF